VCIVDLWGWEPKQTQDPVIVSGIITWPPQKCRSHADCSYNGRCNPETEVCECNASWKGDRCHILNLLPAVRNTGLRIVSEQNGRNISTWGGSVIFDPTNNISHMWAAEISDHCGLNTWTTNSRIIHATSKDPNKNYTRHSVVVPAFAHEPNVVRAPSGEYVMYYTGSFTDDPPPNPCMECTDGSTPEGSCQGGPSGDGPTYMIYATNPYGPWSKPVQLFKSQANFTNLDTNLAVVILPNNSVVGIARNEGPPTIDLTHLVTAEDWRDPDSYKARWNSLLFPNTTVVNERGVEDPFLYMDGQGMFHAIFHNQIEKDDERLCGAHAYSVNGLDWVFTGTAWGNVVNFTDGLVYKFSRRERPHFVFGDRTDPFKITALTTGVQYGPHAPISADGEDACFTLLQPVSLH